MDNGVRRPKQEDDSNVPAATAIPAHLATGVYNQKPVPPRSVFQNGALRPGQPLNGYTLMVAGRRTGKTSFLRLLLDTSYVAQTATQEQLASLAKFVQGCSGRTGHVRTASIDVDVDPDESGVRSPIALTLIDTPSLDFEDEPHFERGLSEILRHVESRFAESMEDEYKARSGDHHVHLCLYFLDPDLIVPPSTPALPAPVMPRARTNSLSHSEPEPVILEPPVTTNPLLTRPVLPMTDINAIRRLSARVNVLPVVARADTLTNDRLAAVKMAIRRDLADAGIGFGIFDPAVPDSHPQYPNETVKPSTMNGGLPNIYGTRPHRTSSTSTASSSPTSPAITPPTLLLPYALISPDIYSHSDGIVRPTQSRHDLVLQYTPSPHRTVINGHVSSCKIEMGRYTRSYRWGFLDVLDPSHCDFIHLRSAIFHHMQTLHRYTKEYLLGKFLELHQQQQPASLRPPIQHSAIPMGSRSLPPLSQHSRPMLAIDTSTHPANRHPSLPVPVMGGGGDPRPSPLVANEPPTTSPTTKSLPTSARSAQKQRPKKITVACNFCRSRKLKCDGGRPACGQCLKRSNPCDYMPNLRRGGRKQRKQEGVTESDACSDEDQSGELDEASLSPEVPTRPSSRRGSNTNLLLPEGVYAHTPLSATTDRRDSAQRLPSLVLPKPNLPGPSSAVFMENNEPPHVSTLPTPITGLPTPNSEFTLPPIRSDQGMQVTTKRRASSGARKSHRSLKYGPKVVACNFCRARKTKCDGAHPSCSSCSRRNLQCSYVNDPTSPNGVRRRKGGTSGSDESQPSPPASHPPHPLSPPLLVGMQGHLQGPNVFGDTEGELKRDLLDSHTLQPLKKMRLEGGSGTSSVP